MPSSKFQYTSTWVTKNAYMVSKFLNFLKRIELEKMDEDGRLYSIVPGYDSIWELMTELKPKVSQDFESTMRKQKLKSQKIVVPALNEKKVRRGRPRIEKQESTGCTLKRKMASSSSMQLSEPSAKVVRRTSPRNNQARQEFAFTMSQSSPPTTPLQAMSVSSRQSKSSTTIKTQLPDDKADQVMTITTPQPLLFTTSRRTRSMTRGQPMISEETRTKKPTKLSRSKRDMNQRAVLPEEIQTTLETSKSSTTLETQLSDNQADQVRTFTTPQSSSSMTSRYTTLKQAVEETNQEAALQIEIEPALETSKSSVTLELQVPDNEDHQEVKLKSEQAFEDIKQETPFNEVSHSTSETFVSSRVNINSNINIEMLLTAHSLLNDDVLSTHFSSTQHVSDVNANDVLNPLDLLAEACQSCLRELGPEIFSLEETDWQWLDKV